MLFPTLSYLTRNILVSLPLPSKASNNMEKKQIRLRIVALLPLVRGFPICRNFPSSKIICALKTLGKKHLLASTFNYRSSGLTHVSQLPLCCLFSADLRRLTGRSNGFLNPNKHLKSGKQWREVPYHNFLQAPVKAVLLIKARN